MNIGIDIDDTINNLHEMIMKYGTEFNNNRNIDFKINPNEWYWDKAFGWDDNLAKEFLEESIEISYLNASIKENAAKIINKLHDEGNKIIIITSRSKLHCKDPYSISKTWLDKKEIIYDEIVVDALDKGSVCKKYKIDVFIDDHIQFCEGVSKEKINVLMFDSPYNQKENRYKRVCSWEDVYTQIIKLKE